jgi:hypothetical protein
MDCNSRVYRRLGESGVVESEAERKWKGQGKDIGTKVC